MIRRCHCDVFLRGDDPVGFTVHPHAADDHVVDLLGYFWSSCSLVVLMALSDTILVASTMGCVSLELRLSCCNIGKAWPETSPSWFMEPISTHGTVEWGACAGTRHHLLS